jgi:hypothetical protein
VLAEIIGKMATYRRLYYLKNFEFELDNVHYILPAVFFPVNRLE